MTLFFSAAMLLLIVRLAKGEEKNMMFARVFSLASNVGFWIGIVRIAVLNRSGFLMFFYITGAMLSYTAMVFAMPHKKEQIAEAAVRFIHDGDSIILDAGSTVLQMVPMLTRFSNITVMTNSLHIVNALSELDNEQTILMPGGTFRKKSASFHGQLAENAFEQFSFDQLFLGTDGIDLNAGVTTFNEVFSVSKAMCNAAREVILMADSSKFGRKSPNVVCSLESVDKLITDAGIDPAFRQALEAKGIEVIITGETNE